MSRYRFDIGHPHPVLGKLMRDLAQGVSEEHDDWAAQQRRHQRERMSRPFGSVLFDEIDSEWCIRK